MPWLSAIRSVSQRRAALPRYLHIFGTVLVAGSAPTCLISLVALPVGDDTSFTAATLGASAVVLSLGVGLLILAYRSQSRQSMAVIIGMILPDWSTDHQVQAARDREYSRRPRPMLTLERSERVDADPANWKADLEILRGILAGYLVAARRQQPTIRAIRLYVQAPVAAAFTIGRSLRFNTHSDLTIASSDWRASSGLDVNEAGLAAPAIDIHHPVQEFQHDFAAVRLDLRQLREDPALVSARLTLPKRQAQHPGVMQPGKLIIATHRPSEADDAYEPAQPCRVACFIAGTGSGIPAVEEHAKNAGASDLLVIEHVGEIAETPKTIERVLATMAGEFKRWAADSNQVSGVSAPIHLIFIVPVVIALGIGALLPKGNYLPLQYVKRMGYVEVWCPFD